MPCTTAARRAAAMALSMHEKQAITGEMARPYKRAGKRERGLMRHCSIMRADLTRPHLGAAMRRSTTLAVSRKSGGAMRTSRMLASPRLRSALSAALRLRTWLALPSASMRWSSERSGAVLDCLKETDIGRKYT